MIQVPRHVLNVTCRPMRGLKSTAMEVQAPFGKRALQEVVHGGTHGPAAPPIFNTNPC